MSFISTEDGVIFEYIIYKTKGREHFFHFAGFGYNTTPNFLMEYGREDPQKLPQVLSNNVEGFKSNEFELEIAYSKIGAELEALS